MDQLFGPRFGPDSSGLFSFRMDMSFSRRVASQIQRRVRQKGFIFQTIFKDFGRPILSITFSQLFGQVPDWSQ